LDRAIRHIHLAHRATPLEAEGYLHLADLAFLEGAPPQVAAAYLQQARRVDPHDGDVLIRAGAEAFLQQEFDEATALWQAAYNTSPDYQRKMVLLLAGRIPVGFFLEKFQPDPSVVGLLERRYLQLQMPHELVPVRRYGALRAVKAAREAEKSSAEDAADLWLSAHDHFRTLEDHKTAAACGQRAVALDPQDFRKRRLVARTLGEAGQHAKAEEFLRWCLDRKPDDVPLKQDLQAAMMSRMRTASASAEAAPQ
jgi:tetratricopeptide (TPR) repeat protein